VVKFRIWLKAIRAPFITSTVISAILGAVIAWYITDQFIWSFFWLTLTGVIFLNIGTNLTNDYFDHKSHLDEINRNPTIFSGGSRVIQDKLLKPKEVQIGGLVAFAVAGVIGIYLNLMTKGNIVLVIGLSGAFLCYFYTAAPLKLGYTPIGELLTGLCAGPFIIYGSFYVQAQELILEPLLISIPLAFSAGLILFINEFPDYEADRKVGKKNIVILLGKKKAVKVYFLLQGFIYILVLSGIISRILPVYSFLVFLTFPLYMRAVKIAGKNYDKITELLPANGSTIAIHLLLGILLCWSFVLDKLI